MSFGIGNVSPSAPYSVGAEITISASGGAIHKCTVTRISEDADDPPSESSTASQIVNRNTQVKVGPFGEAGTYKVAIEDQTTTSASITVAISSRPVGLIDKVTNQPVPTPPIRLPSNPRLPQKPTRPGRGEK
jgi:hypothetical protein